MVVGNRWLAGVCLLPLLGAVLAPEPQQKVEFAKEILPIFKASCFQCHGPDAQMGGLRLDTPEGLAKGGASGPVVVPKSAAKSLLLQRLRGEGGKTRMPMGFAPLKAEQIARIAQWIEEGAVWSGEIAKHWAFVPPVRPEPPALSNLWIRGPIDRFVLAKMNEHGLRPAPPADPETLLRRVSLDLTGLPPTLEEMDAFLADPSDQAYEAAVDRLLASPHFGERMAIGWLDLARYADSNGYEKDARRSMWPYRDWVIDAFNRDLPYDEFTIEQLAGDLLPNATLETRIATGFHRNTMLNEEGGVDKEEQRWLTLVDRVGTTGSVWLGTTIGCAQCHDHKYDPITQKEFYSILAYFDRADEPTLELPDAAVEAKRAELRHAIAELEATNPTEEAVKKKLEDLKKQLAGIHGPTTLVMAEKAAPVQTFMRVRGQFLSKGAEVEPGVLAVLQPIPATAPPNRLGLAEWIASDKNPLTARVEVNRLWEMVFGRGIVETSENFGTQGTPPTHPELLDWLATEFMQRGWSIKGLLREIVTSATYRQASGVSAQDHEKDPDNRWLARGARFRVDAELVRDIALSASGLLNPKIGGPSVFPDQPDGIWDSPYSGDQWKTSEGPDRYRRGVYTFLKRTAPFPMFLAFDSTSRESCTVRRIRTNTPLQALATLNDPFFIDASKALAKRMLAVPGLRERVGLGFRLGTSRRPSEAEVARLVQVARDQTQYFQNHPDEAAKLADSPELAAWTIVGNVLLNLDETMTRS
ncbi:MAG: PSD1 and planctomycete cytochrome C domain-containing protein [Fimbriimonadaceae bacterium]|nr:PSD1 and planctomycete cytochrome C domain-containing protein [Fimbriimonadaceae bacterium]